MDVDDESDSEEEEEGTKHTLADELWTGVCVERNFTGTCVCVRVCVSFSVFMGHTQ
jgi:hypothetical protein